MAAETLGVRSNLHCICENILDDLGTLIVIAYAQQAQPFDSDDFRREATLCGEGLYLLLCLPEDILGRSGIHVNIFALAIDYHVRSERNADVRESLCA